MTAENIRDELISTLNHVDTVFPKLMRNTGRNGVFTFPDVHKLTEGLFLNSWTYWEAFLGSLLWNDLATDTNGVLLKDVRHFRLANGPYRLASRILNHPDHPEKFVEWSDYSLIAKRADEFLGAGHRFMSPLPQGADLILLRRLRNAIAHKSDKAWASFTTMVSVPPFNLAPVQRRGITAGRFLSSHNWNGVPVIANAVAVLRNAAHTLVP
ncbi:MAG: hypothetical protein ACRD5Z_24275 [Bryobacteraceae bacterium]